MRSHLALVAVLSGSIGAPGVAQSPFAAFWKLDETSGTTANDYGPLGNHGTLHNFTGGQWGSGQQGNALTFDGIDDYVDVNIATGLPIYTGRGEPYSIAFWVKAPPQEDRRCYAEGHDQAASGRGALFTLGSGRTASATADKLQVFLRNDALRPLSMYSVSTVFDDTWHHVAWVDVAGRGTLYVDGVQDAGNFDYSQSTLGTRTPNHGSYTTNKVALGAVLRANACCLMTGSLDEVWVFRYALAAADIPGVMNGGSFTACRSSIGEFGVGCGAGPLDLTATGSAAIGGTLNLQLTNGTPNAPAFLCFGVGSITPIDLGPLGFAGCTAYPANLASAGIGALDGAGSSITITTTVPNDNSLLCGLATFQGAALAGTTIEMSPVSILQLGQ